MKHVDRRLIVVGVLSILIGAVGAVDTLCWLTSCVVGWVLPDVSFTAHWDSGFQIYINVFILGLFVGPGILARIKLFRFAGLAVAVIWCLSGLGLLIELLSQPDMGYTAARTLICIVLALYGVWQFSVLRTPEVVRQFREWLDEDPLEEPGVD